MFCSHGVSYYELYVDVDDCMLMFGLMCLSFVFVDSHYTFPFCYCSFIHQATRVFILSLYRTWLFMCLLCNHVIHYPLVT